MPKRGLKRYLKAVAWFGGGAGTCAPAYTYFTTYAPPLFPEVSLILSPLCLALLVASYNFKPEQDSALAGLRPSVKKGLKFLGASLLLLVLYAAMTNLTTVVEPQTGSVRFQVGFGLADWSLTPTGLDAKKMNPTFTAEDLMMAYGAYVAHGPEKLWKEWTINLAGVVMILIYLATFGLWTTAFGLLAKDTPTRQ